MGFDLTTFLAQLVNLFLLVWLLKRFLYRPVLAVIDKRRKEIADSVQQADEQLALATQKLLDIEKQQTEWQKLREKRLDELDRDIRQQKAQMMKELQLDYQTRRETMQHDLDSTWITVENNIREMLTQEFIQLSQKVLTEWSGKSLIDQIVMLFIKRLSSLSSKKHTVLQKIIKNQNMIQIMSSEILTQKQRDTIKQALQKQFVLPPKLRFQFKVKKELLLGIEMRLDTFVVDWNLNNYLDEITLHLKQQVSGFIISPKRKAES